MESGFCFRNHMRCCLLSIHLRYVADRTVRDWRRILSELGVDYFIIETVVEDAIERNCHDSRELAYQGYLKWQQINPKQASFCVLHHALDKLNRNDINEGLKQEFDVSGMEPLFYYCCSV